MAPFRLRTTSPEQLRIFLPWAAVFVGIVLPALGPLQSVAQILIIAPAHELGHAIALWLAGRFALPTFLFITISSEESSWFVFLVVFAILGAATMHLSRLRTPKFAVVAGGFLAAQLYLSFVASHSTIEKVVAAAGLLGESLIGAAALTIAFILPTRIVGQRLVTLACAGGLSLGWSLSRWIRINLGAEELPYGSLLMGGEAGDLNTLRDTFGWSDLDMQIFFTAAALVATGFALFVSIRATSFEEIDTDRCHGATSKAKADWFDEFRQSGFGSLETVLVSLVDVLRKIVSWKDRTNVYNEHLAAMIYLVLWSDRRMDDDETTVLNKFLRNFKHDQRRTDRQRILRSMGRARASGEPISTFAHRFAKEVNGNHLAIRLGFEWLVLAAGCNAEIDSVQIALLTEAANALGLPKGELEDTIERLLGRTTSKHSDTTEDRWDRTSWEGHSRQSKQRDYSSHQWSSQSRSRFEREDPLLWAYKALDCRPGDDVRTIKRSYREAVRTVHPDAFAGQNLPPEMLRKMTKRFHEVQAAYDALCESVGESAGG